MRSEKELLTRARRFEQTSLVEIYQRYSPGLYRYAVRLLGDQDLAEDCVSETFSRLIEALKNGGGPYEHLQAYLYKIAHNWINDYFRHEASLISGISPNLRSHARETSRVVQERLELDKIRAAMADLSPEQREVLALKYLKNWSNSEIARALGKTEGAIRVLHHRGVARLKRFLVEVKNIL
jgi:RNA polymerase sigma-70 factor (ECF subfamily)